MSIVVHSTVERQSVGRSVVAVAGLAGAVCRIVALGVLVLAGLAAIGGILVLILILVLTIICKILLDLYMQTKSGYLLRAVGDNHVLVTSLAKDQGNVKILGLAISNGLVSLAGCVFAQEERVFEISMGTGAMVIGLASVIIGTSIFKKISFVKTTTAVLVGSIIYKACVAVAIRNFEPQAMKLITAILFLVVLVISMGGKKKVKGNA